eukprot:gene8578-biopygen12145
MHSNVLLLRWEWRCHRMLRIWRKCCKGRQHCRGHSHVVLQVFVQAIGVGAGHVAGEFAAPFACRFAGRFAGSLAGQAWYCPGSVGDGQRVGSARHKGTQKSGSSKTKHLSFV